MTYEIAVAIAIALRERALITTCEETKNKGGLISQMVLNGRFYQLFFVVVVSSVPHSISRNSAMYICTVDYA